MQRKLTPLIFTCKATPKDSEIGKKILKKYQKENDPFANNLAVVDKTGID